MTPTFSIGIAFKDPGPFFEMAIQSVFAQTFSDWELILVDDGSTDGSVEFAKRLDDPRVSVYCDGLKRNLNVRLNEMVGRAKGRYFARMDADDVMHPDRLQQQYLLLNQSDNNTVVGSACYSINRDSQVIGRRRVPTRQRAGFAARHSFDHPTVAASAAWFRSNPYSEKVTYHRSEDAELWCRTTPQSTFVVLSEPLLFYREGGTFSYDGFIGTKLGLLFLLKQHNKMPIYRYIYLFTIQIIQLWIGCLYDSIGKADWIIKRRYGPLNETLRREAEAVLERVRGHVLPIRSQFGVD